MPSKIDRLLKDTSVRTRTADQMREALCHFYLGRGSKKECFDAVNGCSETTYYRLKNEHPDLVAAIDNSARREALYRTNGEDIAFQARQKRRSRAIQEWAIGLLLDPRVMQATLDIALGIPRQVEVDGATMTIIVYPRDQLKAIALLQDLARGGVLPQTQGSFTDILPVRGKTPSQRKNMTTLESIGAFGVRTDLSTITASKPDGQSIKVSVLPQSKAEIRRKRAD
jgi:hypothetical protein